jgi:transposase
MITAKGVQGICNYHHEFKNMYLFGAFSPITGEAFLLELPECNTDMFQLYLDNFALQKPDELKIVFLDNGAFHKAKRLIIPANIILVFIPPYSPELNPAELDWKFLKARIVNKAFKKLEDLSNELMAIIQKHLSIERIKSITNFRLYTNNFMTIYEI